MTDVKKFALDWLAQHLQDIEGDANIMPIFYLVNSENNESALVAVDGELMNDSKAKHALGQKLRSMIAETGADTVLSITDTWYARIKDPKVIEVRDRLNLNVVQMDALGLCEKHEAILCMVECKGGPNLILRQLYTRDPEGKITLGRLLEEEDMKVGRGNFTGFFQ